MTQDKKSELYCVRESSELHMAFQIYSVTILIRKGSNLMLLGTCEGREEDNINFPTL